MPTLHAGLAIVGGGPAGAWLALEATRDADPLRAPVVLFDGSVDEAEDAAGPPLPFDPAGRVLHGAAASLAPLLKDGAPARSATASAARCWWGSRATP